jgi:hypothetical protein
MIRSFPDSGVLIQAARSRTLRADIALEYLSDPHRRFLTSSFVWLETVPKAAYMRRASELEYYETFFDDTVVTWCRDWDNMDRLARETAQEYGLCALDALHVAAAHLLGADELVTVEAPSKPLYRTGLVQVTYLRANP